jgi:hypothetical protein|tara:strand:- start:1375 stop:1662 length:288 start_codon:yes stop_codon:yes gene_type:complete
MGKEARLLGISEDIIMDKWYDDLESSLYDLSSGKIDSTTCLEQVMLLGYTAEEAIEEILPDEDDGSDSETSPEWGRFMEGRLPNMRRKELIERFK